MPLLQYGGALPNLCGVAGQRRLEVVKEEIAGRVDSAGDATPLAKVKDAIDRMQMELKSMEARRPYHIPAHAAPPRTRRIDAGCARRAAAGSVG